MPTMKRSTTASSPVDESTRVVWLLALNCLAACLLPLRGIGAETPRGEPIAVVSPAEGHAVVPAGSGADPLFEPFLEPAALAHLSALGAAAERLAHLDAGALPFTADPRFAARDRVRAEHFCALYGCLPVLGGE